MTCFAITIDLRGSRWAIERFTTRAHAEGFVQRCQRHGRWADMEVVEVTEADLDRVDFQIEKYADWASDGEHA